MPSWNGDLRLEPDSGDPKTKTTLSIVEPTEAEKVALGAIGGILIDRKWIDKPITEALVPGEPYRDGQVTSVTINAPLEEVGPVLIAVMKPGPAVLTAVRFKDGHIETVEHRGPRDSSTSSELAAAASKPKAEAAVTVKRPTPSCPECYVGAVGPANEVLLSFLTPEQHRTWARERYVIVRGGLTGHRYVIAHRATEIAARNQKICWDADDRDTLHFHDQSVPPEEEVLSAMLILQHREPWLRNEATCLGVRFSKVFKNPFGDHLDGVADAALTRVIGILADAASS